MESAMKLSHLLILSSLVLIAPNVVRAQVAGSTVVGVAAAEMRDVAMGWSAKRQVLGAPVYNDQNERIGNVDDIIISPDKAISYAIINAGGFLQVTKHDVAVPVSQLKLVEGKLVLPGATRDALKASPEFEYAH
jgi:sporulation protein YlmC with PRC-barrel domain